LAVRYVPSADLFVVRPGEGKRNSLDGRLAALGEAEELKGGEALVLRVASSSTDAKAAWRRVHKSVGAAATIQPVLLDQEGEPHYPTGEISVRFHQTPSDQELQKFAAAHGLRLRGRNEFVPQQAVFQPSDPAKIYLPDLVDEIASATGTREVWANTLSHYRRI
jgi:hypothetical protein